MTWKKIVYIIKVSHRDMFRQHFLDDIFNQNRYKILQEVREKERCELESIPRVDVSNLEQRLENCQRPLRTVQRPTVSLDQSLNNSKRYIEKLLRQQLKVARQQTQKHGPVTAMKQFTDKYLDWQGCDRGTFWRKARKSPDQAKGCTPVCFLHLEVVIWCIKHPFMYQSMSTLAHAFFTLAEDDPAQFVIDADEAHTQLGINNVRSIVASHIVEQLGSLHHGK